VYLGWLRAVWSVRRLRRRVRLLIVVVHEIYVRPDDRLRVRAFARCQRWAVRRLATYADAVVVADRVRRERLGAQGIDPKSVRVIPVGSNVPVPASLSRAAASSSIVLFGLLHPNRDLETVVQAVGELRRELPHVQLRIIGELGDDPARRERLAELIAALGAPASIDGFMEVDALAAVLAQTGAFVSTYIESVSLGSGTIAAALGFGVPVVVYDEATLHDSLVAGVNVLAAPRVPVELARALSLALGETGRRVGAAGRDLYERELDWTRIATRFDELLNELEQVQRAPTTRRPYPRRSRDR
jgi:glycosyltransferase involved in cell wall biosynthesis